jgi:hypothetical protein
MSKLITEIKKKTNIHLINSQVPIVIVIYYRYLSNSIRKYANDVLV